MVRRRTRSRSRRSRRSAGRIKYGVNGLPLPSSLTKKHLGIVMEDKKGHLKELDVNRVGNLTWVKAQVGELTQKQADSYFSEIESNLDDADLIRDILFEALQKVQPKITTRI